jgi:hypothetical protein
MSLISNAVRAFSATPKNQASTFAAEHLSTQGKEPDAGCFSKKKAGRRVSSKSHVDATRGKQVAGSEWCEQDSAKATIKNSFASCSKTASVGFLRLIDSHLERLAENQKEVLKLHRRDEEKHSLQRVPRLGTDSSEERRRIEHRTKPQDHLSSSSGSDKELLQHQASVTQLLQAQAFEISYLRNSMCTLRQKYKQAKTRIQELEAALASQQRLNTASSQKLSQTDLSRSKSRFEPGHRPEERAAKPRKEAAKLKMGSFGAHLEPQRLHQKPEALKATRQPSCDDCIRGSSSNILKSMTQSIVPKYLTDFSKFSLYHSKNQGHKKSASSIMMGTHIGPQLALSASNFESFNQTRMATLTNPYTHQLKKKKRVGLFGPANTLIWTKADLP